MPIDDLAAMIHRRTPILIAAHLPEKDHFLARSMGQKNKKVRALTMRQKKRAAMRYRRGDDAWEIAEELQITIESLRNVMSKMGIKRPR